MLCFVTGKAEFSTADIGKKPDIPSWQTYEFMKYGAVGASLYTGTINYSVPLYTYKDSEFDIPLSIDYATNGFRINHKSGILGQSWALGGIGVITREIKGLPDERTRIVGGGGSISSEELYGYKYIPSGPFSKGVLCDLDNRVYTCLIADNNKSYDAEPDIYHFNFCGFSGSFRRSSPDCNDNPQFVFFDEASDSKALVIKALNENGNIILLDGNGYEYLFEPDEYIKEPKDDAVGAPRVQKITAWHLRKITAPSGRKVDFFYTTNDNIETEISFYPTLSSYFSCVGSFEIINGGTSSQNIEIVDHRQFKSELESVHFPDDTRMLFNYEEGAQEYHHKTPNGPLDIVRGSKNRLSSVSVSYGDKLIKNIKFSYETKHSSYTETGNNITFLHGIDISGQGRFSFEYYPMIGYPALGSIKCDHWGYYNGESGGFSVANFFSNVSYDSDYNESYNSSFHKSPNFDAALSGSLKKITYPTGGYSSISYEPHTYSMNVVRNRSTLFEPQLCNTDTICETGGIRLKQIITFLSDSVPNDTTTYDYCNSGILLNCPRYGIQYTAPTSLDVKVVKYFNLTNDMFNYNRTHIEYSKVREYKTGQGYKDYTFSTYFEFPDPTQMDIEEDKDSRMNIFNFFKNNGYNDVIVSSTNPNNLVTNILTPFASMQKKRGLLKKEEYFDNNGTLLKCRENTYSFPFVCLDTIYTITGEIAREVYYPRFNIALSRSEEKDYFNGNIVSKITDFEYNEFGMPNVVTTTTSDGENIVEKKKYSGDTLAVSGVLLSMKEHNIVNVELESETKKSNTLLNKIRYNYYCPDENNMSLVRPSGVEFWTPSEGWRLKSSFLFDNKGLLSQLTDANGIHTSYLWSYCGKHPIAIAQNASWQTLVQGLNASGSGSPEQLRELAFLDDNTYNHLRNLGAYLPGALVDIYKYKPNAGVSEVVSPNSLRTFYNYDGYGRLASIADANLKTFEQREYNLVSITPLSANSNFPTNCHINDNIILTVDSHGGSEFHEYRWNIKDPQDNSIYQITSSTGSLEFTPYKIGMDTGENYTVECTVIDLLSDESVNVAGIVHTDEAIIQFSDVNTTIDMISGTGVTTASIYTDSPVTVTFQLNGKTAGTCTLKVGNTIRTLSNLEGTYSFSLGTGVTNIELLATSFAEINLSLQIISAGTHEIGDRNIITIEF